MAERWRLLGKCIQSSNYRHFCPAPLGAKELQPPHLFLEIDFLPGSLSQCKKKTSPNVQNAEISFACVLNRSDSLPSRTVARQDPLSREFARQEYWSGLLCPSPEDLLDPGDRSGISCDSCIGRRILYHYAELNPRAGGFQKDSNMTAGWSDLRKKMQF